jgi:hypothetical protein
LAKSQLPGRYWWVIELKGGSILAECEIGRQDSWGDLSPSCSLRNIHHLSKKHWTITQPYQEAYIR